MSWGGLQISAVALISFVLLSGAVVALLRDSEAGRAGADATPPARFDGSPTGTLPAGTTSTMISLRTDEAATCRYSRTPGVAYHRMKDSFSSTGGTSHSTLVDGLVDGGTYTYHVRCRDLARNANPDDYAITFRVGLEGDCALPPTRSAGYARSSSDQPPFTLPGGETGTWRVVPSPNVAPDPTREYLDNTLVAVDAISADDAWAVGYTNYYGHFDPLALHWDGGQWTTVPLPDPPLPVSQLYGVAGSSSNDVWAVGASYDHDTVRQQTLIYHWDGARWSLVPSPSPGSPVNELRGVAAVSPNDAWAVGFCAGFYAASTVILHWDGVTWSRVPSPSPSTGSGDNRLFGISAISADDIWAVGITSSSTSAFAPLTLHWDGVAWSAIPNSLYGGAYGSFFRSVSGVSSDDVLAVGATAFPAGLEGGVRYLAFAARWDGTAWTQILDINRLDPDDYPYSTNFYGVSAVAHDFAWVVGEYTGDAWIYQWNGTALNEVPAPDLPWYNTLYAADALTTDSAWAVGRYAVEGVSGTKTLTERYSVP